MNKTLFIFFLFLQNFIYSEKCNSLLKELFGYNQSDKKPEFLQNSIYPNKAILFMCPGMEQSCCSQSLIDSLIPSFSQSYGYQKVQEKVIASIVEQYNNMNHEMLGKIISELLELEEFKQCTSYDIKYFREVQEKLKKQISNLNTNWEIFRTDVLQFYGGFLCSVCSSDSQGFIQSYKTQEENSTEYLDVQLGQQSKKLETKILKNYFDILLTFVLVADYSKAGFCFSKILRDKRLQNMSEVQKQKEKEPENELSFMLDIYETFRKNYGIIKTLLEKCINWDVNSFDYVDQTTGQTNTLQCNQVYLMDLFNSDGMFRDFRENYKWIFNGLRVFSSNPLNLDENISFTDMDKKTKKLEELPDYLTFLERKDSKKITVQKIYKLIGLNVQKYTFNHSNLRDYFLSAQGKNFFQKLFHAYI